MDIAINDKTGQMTLAELKQIEDLLNFAAGYLDVSVDSEMSVTFMDNVDIQTINRNYRGKDAPTDVISFGLEEKGKGELPIFLDEEMEDLPRNLGDIMISIEKAKEQAKAYGHSYKRELGFLAIHGFLHINGYDHQTSEEEKEMSKLQKEILDAYGLKREQSKEI
ncbi:MAG: rRNA maturation RNase YbeY [Lactobacillales bacterium]|jgi:probable rRNA maturation factor|nr:rRNA maturation RNase YbeY [Lactobacillales bacterium]